VSAVRHLYVHLPFCAHRCGYCDFVTVVGRESMHACYVSALIAELELHGEVLADPLETIFLGGGTPTFTAPAELRRLLAALPPADEVTIEANPETVTGELAHALRASGVSRVSLGAQSFQPHLLEILERQAEPDAVRRAFYDLRGAGFDNISLDLIYGIPGQSTSDLDADLAETFALAPEHVSAYELEAKPRTRFTRVHGNELERQAEKMERYFERVVETLVRAGYRWYETANFCLEAGLVGGRDLRARHNMAYWRARDYLGIGIGAVSTVAGTRWRNAPNLTNYVEALERTEAPRRDVELLDAETRARERLMLGLRLDEPLVLDAEVSHALDHAARARLTWRGLVQGGEPESGPLALTRRGRFLGDAVTAELVAG